MAIQFGVVSNIIGSLGFDIEDDFELVNVRKANSKQSAIGVGNKGDVIKESQYGERDEYTLSFTVNADGKTGLELVLGQVFGASEPKFCLTGFELVQVPADVATLSVTGHVHTGSANPHIARIYTVTLPNIGFGVVASLALAGTLPDGIQRLVTRGSVNHIDKENRTGGFLIGVSTQGRIEEQIDVLKDGTITLNSGWVKDSDSDDEPNTNHLTRSIACHKFLAADV